jgi:glutamate 5-kinase
MRETLKNKKRIVVKIGSSSLTHPETGMVNLQKIEELVRVLCDLRGMGMDVILVSSGAIAVGRTSVGLKEKPTSISKKQALAAIGQAKLMMTYQTLFAQYTQMTAQVLITKNNMLNDLSRNNAHNTFNELLSMGVIPVVNENDTVATYEIEDVFGDNDHLSAIVAALISADLLVLLSDIDGLYTDDPAANPDAKLVPLISNLTQRYLSMGKDSSSSDFGTGGMMAKLDATRIALHSGADVVIANGKNVKVLLDIIEGKECGTLFLSERKAEFDLMTYLV